MDYIILRDAQSISTAEPFDFPMAPVGPMAGGMGAASRGAPRDPTAAVIERAELSPRELRDTARDPSVRAVAPPFPTKLIKPVDLDTDDDAAWGVDAVGATTSPFTGAGVTVAVLDTGIDADHSAFNGVNITEKDFSGSGNGDEDGHGTHCAGTIFGRDVDGQRIGVAPGVTDAFIGKVLGPNGGDTAMIVDGVKWASDNGADVISMSLGYDFPGLVDLLIEQHDFPADAAASYALQGYRANLRLFDALMNMLKSTMLGGFSNGALICAAAGNENEQARPAHLEIAVALPAAADGVLSVGALRQGSNGLTVASFSNTFPQIAAPGVGILSAKAGGGLMSLSGTSMATPHVAGVAALWWEALRSIAAQPTAQHVLARLLATASRSGLASGVDEADVGVGIVSAPKSPLS